MPLHVNAHPDSHLEETEHSVIPHPPTEDHHGDSDGHKDIPDTGWTGQPPIPSQEGGDYETDFMNKPPYFWKSEGDKFKKHYTSWVKFSNPMLYLLKDTPDSAGVATASNYSDISYHWFSFLTVS